METLRPLVFCGPSGSGKSTFLERLMKDYPGRFGFSVSHTTRKPRPGEVDGVHYHFTDMETMKKAIQDGKFIETACFSGNMYGTSKESIERVIHDGKVCILDIDVQGVKQVKQTDLNPFYVFISPPSIDELEKRLRARNTETEESLQQRVKTAEEEVIYGTEKNFDKIIVNDNFDHAYSELKFWIEKNVLKGQPNGVGGDGN